MRSLRKMLCELGVLSFIQCIVLVVCLTVLPSLLYSSSHQQTAKETARNEGGPLTFVSENRPTFKDIIERGVQDNSIYIQGHLYMPKRPDAKVPAAVILPGAGGFDEDDDRALVNALNEVSIAALAFDPNKARNISEWPVAARVISDAMRVCDAFGALKALSVHPGIDSKRVAVIGRSRGGLVALLTASEIIRRALVGNELVFAAHIAVYPGCHVQMKEPNFTGAPILMLLAEKDNVTPARLCLDYMGRIKTHGHPIQAITYKGAAHGFTKSTLYRRTIKLKELPDVSKCIDRHLLVQNDGSWYFSYKNKVLDTEPSFYDLNADCVRPAQGVIGDPTGVRIQSFKDIQTFLKEVFALQ